MSMRLSSPSRSAKFALQFGLGALLQPALPGIGPDGAAGALASRLVVALGKIVAKHGFVAAMLEYEPLMPAGRG